jgi:hypothetical protein
MNNYICCCECEYQDICYACDAFGGCTAGKRKEHEPNILLMVKVGKYAKLNDN